MKLENYDSPFIRLCIGLAILCMGLATVLLGLSTVLWVLK